MAYLKIRHKEKAGYRVGKYHDDHALIDVISYIFDPRKIPSGYVGGLAVNPNNAVYEMSMLSRCYAQDSGVRLRHMILAFESGELDTMKRGAACAAYQIGYEAAKFYGWHYQIVYAVHENTDIIHIHFVMNTTDYLTGLKYEGKKADLYRFLEHTNAVLEQYGTSAVFLQDDEDRLF